MSAFFFFNDTATTEIYTLSLHDALPIFPKTIYVTTSGTTSGPNLAGLAFGFAEPSYLAGILAASMSKTNKLGVIGGTELPPIRVWGSIDQAQHLRCDVVRRQLG